MLDKLLPLFVGNRTELLATGIAGLQIAAAFGAVDKAAADETSKILAALGAGTLAAKLQRQE